MNPKYLRMIEKMKSSGGREWSVYVLRCADGSLYTGVAKDVAARLLQHRQGKGAAYTRTHRPVDLVYREEGLTRSQALLREAELKRWPKPRKELLVRGIKRAVAKRSNVSSFPRPVSAISPLTDRTGNNESIIEPVRRRGSSCKPITGRGWIPDKDVRTD